MFKEILASGLLLGSVVLSPVNVNYEGEKAEIQQQVFENQDVQARSVWTYSNYIADCTPNGGNDTMSVQFTGKYLSFATNVTQGSGAKVNSYRLVVKQQNWLGIPQVIGTSSYFPANGNSYTPFSGLEINPDKPVTIIVELQGEAGCTANVSLVVSSSN